MATDPAVAAPNPVQQGDARVLIGVLAILEGAIWAADVTEQTISKVAERFVQQGLLAADHDQRGLRQAINDMNQRLRYAVGDYGSPPPRSRSRHEVTATVACLPSCPALGRFPGALVTGVNVQRCRSAMSRAISEAGGKDRPARPAGEAALSFTL